MLEKVWENSEKYPRNLIYPWCRWLNYQPQVVQDFFHQQYGLWNLDWFSNPLEIDRKWLAHYTYYILSTKTWGSHVWLIFEQQLKGA